MCTAQLFKWTNDKILDLNATDILGRRHHTIIRNDPAYQKVEASDPLEVHSDLGSGLGHLDRALLPELGILHFAHLPADLHERDLAFRHQNGKLAALEVSR